MTVYIYELSFSFFSGLLIGLFYFGGLWWTLRRMPVSHEPVIWVIGSFLVRATVSLVGFYFVSGVGWIKLLICLSGFILVRIVFVTSFKRAIVEG